MPEIRLDPFLFTEPATAGAFIGRSGAARPAAKAGATLNMRALGALLGTTNAEAPVAAHPAVTTAKAEDLQQTYERHENSTC